MRCATVALQPCDSSALSNTLTTTPTPLSLTHIRPQFISPNTLLALSASAVVVVVAVVGVAVVAVVAVPVVVPVVDVPVVVVAVVAVGVAVVGVAVGVAVVGVAVVVVVVVRVSECSSGAHRAPLPLSLTHNKPL